MSAVVMDGSTITLLRRDDMVVLDFGFANLSRRTDAAGSEVLVETDPAAPAFIEVTFPPQAMLEQSLAPDDLAVEGHGARFSGPSRLTFEVVPGTSIPFTAAGLLAWAGLLSAPSRTAIECVWDLTLRPAIWPDDVWAHAGAPVTTAAGVTELWHTRLTTAGRPDPRPAPIPLENVRTMELREPFRSSLTTANRHQIARAAAVRPLLARELTLSALGATIDLVGDWTDIEELDGFGYRHRAVIGRDQFVMTTERGHLLPFGFPAELTKYTTRIRQFGKAVLFQIHELRVLGTEVQYDRALGIPSESRAFPFRSARADGPLTAEVTLTPHSLATGVSWVNAPSGQRLAFDVTAHDFEGHGVSFSVAVAFVPRRLPFGDLTRATVAYDAERSTVPAAAAGRVALAPAAAPGESAVDVTALYIGAQPAEADPGALEAAGQIAAFPRLAAVDARIPAIEAFAARGGRAPVERATEAVTSLLLDADYVAHGLRGPGVYARLKQQVAFAPPVTSAGGLTAVAVPVSGLSTAAGLIGGDVGAFVQDGGRFDPAEYFKPERGLAGFAPPELLGFVPLPDIVAPASLGDGEAVPRIATDVIFPGGDRTQPPEAVRSTVTWRPKVKPDLYRGTLRITTDTKLDLRSTTLARLRGGTPSSEVRGELRSFSLEFADGPLVLVFERLAFTAQAGATPSLDAKVADVQFGRGALRFLDRLRQYLPSPPNGPRVTVGRDSIEASHTLAIPSVSSGVFLLQNLSLSASLTLPLTGRPVRARFAVSSRDHPFLVTVSLFGGGGFFALTVAGNKLDELEAQLDFGAATALNLGVASASVVVTAGIHIFVGPQGASLEGFFRAVGELDVLGLVSVSVEVYLALGYREVPKNPAQPLGPKRGEAFGSARLTVRVRVLFFSESISLSIERSFGAGSDPTFELAFPSPDPWRERCAAFAPMVES